MRVYLESLGCRLNQSEMDTLSRRLLSNGHELVTDPVQAELCVVNTCAVTAEAERKSRQTARHLHRSNPEADVVLTGCSATLHPDRLATLPGVVQVVPNDEKEQLLELLFPQQSLVIPTDTWPLPAGKTRAFVKVQDGCDNRCSYCVTTVARGPAWSRPPAEILNEIRALAAAGYREVVLTGVHLGSYGRGSLDKHEFDTVGANPLQVLIQRILDETPLERLRLSSLEPWDLPADLFALWQDPRLCRQLHLPLQCGSDSVLSRMRRKITAADYAALARQALDQIPDLALTTDLIVGFPGETDAEFQESLTLVDSIAFARLHVFGYSSRPGTEAAVMPGQLARTLVKERGRQMRELGRRKQTAFLQRFLGRTLKVLWESPNAAGEWRGHTDNYIQVITTDPAAQRNHITPVHLTQRTRNGLRGVIVSET